MRRKWMAWAMCLLMLAGLCLYGPAAHAEEATDACTYTVPKDTEAAWLTDERVLSRVNVPKGKNIVLSLPAGRPPRRVPAAEPPERAPRGCVYTPAFVLQRPLPG